MHLRWPDLGTSRADHADGAAVKIAGWMATAGRASHFVIVPRAILLRRLRAARSPVRRRGLRQGAHRPAAAGATPDRHLAGVRRRPRRLALPTARCARARPAGLARHHSSRRAGRRPAVLHRRHRARRRGDRAPGHRRHHRGRHPQPCRRAHRRPAGEDSAAVPRGGPADAGGRHGGRVLRHRAPTRPATASTPTTPSTRPARPTPANSTPTASQLCPPARAGARPGPGG